MCSENFIEVLSIRLHHWIRKYRKILKHQGMEPPLQSNTATLNVLCGICSEFYTNNDQIFVTKCGHVFHQQCLFQWLKVSHTCPQCRDSCLRHQCRRLYLNFELPRVDDERTETPPPITSSGYEWVPIDGSMDDELLKTFAFHYGTNEDGDNIYAARSVYNGDLVPCYYCPKRGGAIVPWGFKSHFINRNIDVLDISCDDAQYKWIAASEGNIPDNAMISGHTMQYEPLYIARAQHEGRLLYGKLHRQYKMAYMPYKDVEACNTKYDVLVREPKTENEANIST